MKTEHTMEPWTLHGHGLYAHFSKKNAIRGADKSAVYYPGGDCGTMFSPEPYPGEEISEANARRIVACVNACAGISTELLESGIPRGDTPESKNADLKRAQSWDLLHQRDELLAACKSGEELLGIICEVICAGNPPPHGVERLAAMRAAIAKVEGRS